MKYNGLSDQEVEKSRESNGSNVIPDSEPTTFWAEFKETFGDPMIKILLAIAAIMIVMFFFGQAAIYEPIGTIVAILIVATVSAKTGVASDTKYRELKDSTEKDKCKVYRNGLVTVIDIDDVVVGDKVLLQSGDKIPVRKLPLTRAFSLQMKLRATHSLTNILSSGERLFLTVKAFLT